MIHSNFLLQGKSIGMTLLIPAYPMDAAFARIELVAHNGYSDIDFYACNRGDNPFHQSHHETDAAVSAGLLIACCAHAKTLGLDVTLWGFADDSNWRLTEAIQKQAKFLPILEPHIARYVVALEGNETFGVGGVQLLVKDAKRSCGTLPLFLHWTHGMHGGASWPVSGIYYQYEHSLSGPSSVEAETKASVGKWHDARKLFIAGEFHDTLTQDQARACGDAAIRGGADGSACGATGQDRPSGLIGTA